MKTAKQQKAGPITRLYNKMHWFTDKEAWGVFRFAAYVEAGFWIFCIASIVYGVAELPQAESVVAFGRSIVGTAFVVYAILVVIVARSMEWRGARVVLALGAGILPLGSVIYERYVAWLRKKSPPRIAPPAHLEE